MATRSDRPDPDPNRPAGSATPNTPSGGAPQRTAVVDASAPPPQARSRRIRYAGGGDRTPVIVLKVKRGRRRGRKRYSKNSKDAQRLTYGTSRALYRLADGLAAGTESFWRRSNRSARRKRDGLAVDFYRNAARGIDRASRQAGKAPYEIARKISGRRAWKTLRYFIRNSPFRFGYVR
jgi:hypothetical protein